MAESTTRGWRWTEDEKAWARTWHSRIERERKSLADQLGVFDRALPECADEARRLSTPIIEAAECLSRVDPRRHGRMYDPLSVDEARQFLETLGRAEAAFAGFISREDTAAAIARLRRSTRAAKKQRADAERQVGDYVLGPKFDVDLERVTDHVIDQAETSVPLFCLTSGFTLDEDAQLLQRWVLVLFVRTAFLVRAERRAHVRSALRDGQKANDLRGILRETIRIIIHEQVGRKLRGSSVTFSTPERYLGAHWSYFLGTGQQQLREWAAEGKRAADIPDEAFVIFGRNCREDDVPAPAGRPTPSS